ncbi:hypothetical protein PV387_43600, partial [Streptomyces sp. ME02-6987-2C]|uniref:hypothetical protein n=1 Tax=unclassified Streptomyces TaxID=2593676 RepID=UPI0029AF455E
LLQLLPLLIGQPAHTDGLCHHTPNDRTDVAAHPSAAITNPANLPGQSTSHGPIRWPRCDGSRQHLIAGQQEERTLLAVSRRLRGCGHRDGGSAELTRSPRR